MHSYCDKFTYIFNNDNKTLCLLHYLLVLINT